MVYEYNSEKSKCYNGLLLEMQFRTQLQHAWAMAVETMGTVLSQSLKSSQGSEDWLEFFAMTGSAFAAMESCPAIPGYEDLSKNEIFNIVKDKAQKLDVINKLTSFSVALDVISEKKQGNYHLLTLDLEKKSIMISSFGQQRLEEASTAYADIETKIKNGANLQVVLVSTSSIDMLKKAYPSYFLDTTNFISRVREISKSASKTVF